MENDSQSMVPMLGTAPTERLQQESERTKGPKNVTSPIGSPDSKNSLLSKVLRIEDPLMS